MFQNIVTSLRKIKYNWVWTRADMFLIDGNVNIECSELLIFLNAAELHRQELGL